jgi:hypothetical protein
MKKCRIRGGKTNHNTGQPWEPEDDHDERQDGEVQKRQAVLDKRQQRLKKWR